VPVAGFRVAGSRVTDRAEAWAGDEPSHAATDYIPGRGVVVRVIASPIARPRRRPQPMRRFNSPVVVAAAAGALSFGLLTSFGDTIRKPGSFLTELDRIAEVLGFGLRQVEVSGHKFTTDAAILDSLDLERVRSLVSFNALAARERIEKLPWVATASVTRLLPDGLAITVTERQPSAVWQSGDREMLIDARGHRLSSIRVGAAPDLPRVSGPGAPEASTELFGYLVRYPEIASRLVVAERIAERRWTLRLTGELEVLLPAVLTERPFETLLKTFEGRRLVDVGAGQLDLRHAIRIVASPTHRPSRPPPVSGIRAKPIL
jgi:cell division protein FtsQ